MGVRSAGPLFILVCAVGLAVIGTGTVFGWLVLLPSLWAALVLLGGAAAEVGWIALCTELLT